MRLRRGWTSILALGSTLACATAQAGIEIQIPEVSEQIQNNVRAFLSMTRYADRDDVTDEVMNRLQRRITAETQEALQPLGYYEPQISHEVSRDNEQWRVIIRIDPGPAVTLQEVQVSAAGAGANARPVSEVLAAGELRSGERLNHGTYERVKGSLLRAAQNEGYLDASMDRHELVIDRLTRTADVDLHMQTGERYSFGEITIAQDVIHERAMRRLLRMQPGDPYTLDALLRTQYVLDDTQYFSGVDIESGDPDHEARTVPVTISADPNRRHRYGTSLGYGTDTEIRGKFTWDNRRVNRAGHKFKMELLGSAIIQELSARYAIPVMDIALEKLEFGATVKEEELGDTLSQRAELSAGLTEVMGRWQRVLSVRAMNETTTEADGLRRTDFYVIPSITYSTLPSYIVGGRARPYFLSAELRGSPETLGSDTSFLQLRLKGERIFDFGERWHLHLRTELGATRIDETNQLPASQRFFVGGEGSVRGFALNELAPRDDQNRTIGGSNLATATVELVRDLPRNFGVAVFYDTGNAFESFSDPQLEYAAGLGVRYRIAVASFGVDVAQPLSVSGRNPRLHLYIATQF